MVIITTAYCKIKELTKPIKIIQGGQGASKTYSILQDFHYYAEQNPRTISTVISATYPMLKDGPIQDMSSIITSFNLNFNDMFNKSDKDLKYKNGSIIQFRNLDSKDFHKGKGARRQRLFINEGNRGITWSSIEQMITRTSVDVTIDYNPDFEFWAHDQYLKPLKPDVDYISLTYLDNAALPKGERKKIEQRIEDSKKPGASDGLKNWVQIYAYGKLGTYTERQILDYNFIDAIPSTAKRINSGMDFGLSPDRTVLIDLYVEGNNLYLDERICMNNLMAEKIAGAERLSIVDQMEAIKFEKGRLIVADSAGRTAILDIRKHQYNIIGVKKKPGSQIDGLNKLRGYNIYLTRRSTNTKKDFESFYWKVDANGKVIPQVEGHEPDTIAATRYAMMGYYQT